MIELYMTLFLYQVHQHHQQQQQNNAAAAAAASAAAVTSAAAAGQALGYLSGVQAMDHSTAGVFGAIGQVSFGEWIESELCRWCFLCLFIF